MSWVPDLSGIFDVMDIWQVTVNMLATLSPLLAVFVGMGLFFTFIGWLKDFLQARRDKQQPFY